MARPLQLLVGVAIAAGLPACKPAPDQAVTAPANVTLIVRDTSDPTCGDDAPVAWALYWPFEDDFSSPKWLAALPSGKQALSDLVPPACSYSAAVTVPAETLTLEWRVRAFDEGAWVATCEALLLPTSPGTQNVVRFTRGTPGCVLNP